ncbi:MAG: tetraacyldisaccharide 4'-kinase, partial [Armatimonadetes bacterium]|nr:tetraacyldisaccharide 4'-kinase [Armatimonadota bacterium]NIM23647.1 tetraacyldisaccharide 4'-kinase [Armatimonadota bacterium]NIM67517.1 tetraacyldisaccharide 4'-kinase [Armatimonadota bacterium]NIO97000.1 tetraacyldisaccharide 4'-kinase [Armatimonadota bacterium]NIT31076.1 tetraacyldisaccharide 4'-kinase [Armatimonadota bacterium]
PFGPKDCRDLAQRARRLGAGALITTEKDAVKFLNFDKLKVPIYYLKIEVEVTQGEARLWEVIERK